MPIDNPEYPAKRQHSKDHYTGTIISVKCVCSVNQSLVPDSLVWELEALLDKYGYTRYQIVKG